MVEAVTSYDREFDIFLLRFGEPRPAITEDLGNGLQLRLDPDTSEILGIEILGLERFVRAWRKRNA